MSIREQYKRAYSLLRDRSWDTRTYKIVCQINGIGQDARIAALRSYSNSRLIDPIGESYRNLLDSYRKIRAEIALGHY